MVRELVNVPVISELAPHQSFLLIAAERPLLHFLLLPFSYQIFLSGPHPYCWGVPEGGHSRAIAQFRESMDSLLLVLMLLAPHHNFYCCHPHQHFLSWADSYCWDVPERGH